MSSVQLELIEAGVSAFFTKRAWNSVKTSVATSMFDRLGYSMGNTVYLSVTLPSEKLNYFWEYPKDWKESFKERWFPRWAVRRWPVQRTRYEARAIYPSISVPEELYGIQIIRDGKDIISPNVELLDVKPPTD